ncbi:MAG: type II toxin-antitoxin system RelE/ParE family toxin [Ruminococcus sp.]|nr:type II toxin-antitoxin system RelE/ParE family toxin [Ruminococcus sp.]MCM1480551.1 type II toxin-antitoxin system RelE/ParE family toxin [Muribaculaceae bacterium]
MYEVIFYRDKSGKSEVEDFIRELAQKSAASKTDRINFTKILSYLNSLSTYGTRIGTPVVKHISDDIWELRPLSNRIFFFYWKDNKFVLLHHFVKKSQKTPKREIDIAKQRYNDFLERSK